MRQPSKLVRWVRFPSPAPVFARNGMGSGGRRAVAKPARQSRTCRSIANVRPIVIFVERYRSGQTGQTVNLLAYAFEGSNPSLSTNLFSQEILRILSRRNVIRSIANNPPEGGPAAELNWAALLDMMLDMTTITMRELMHNPTGVFRIVEQGGTVRLTRRGRPVARLIPEPKPTPRKVEWPDIMARLKSYCGDRVLTGEDMRRMKDEEERSFL